MTVTDATPIISRDAAHHYFYENVQYPSVTTVLEAMGIAFGIASWYGAKHAARAAIEMIAELPRLIETLGPEATAKAIASAGNKYRDDAAQLGTEVHDLADKMIRGVELPFMTPTQLARVEHYRKWWEGEQKQGAKLRLSEAMIVRPMDPGNAWSGWGGTFDLLYYDADGATVLADIKTGGKWGRKVYEKEVLQVAAYGMGKLVQPAEVGFTLPSVYPMPKVDKYKVIHVTGEGCHPLAVDVTSREHMAFLAVLDLYHWQQEQKGKIG